MKKIFALMLIMAMVLSAIPVYADGNQITGTVPGKEWNYYYEDSYFTGNASVYNPSLASLSACLVRSAFADYSAGAENQTASVRSFLGQLGFTDIEVNTYNTQMPLMDSMGVTVARKEINCGGQNFTLLAIVPRTAGYLAEWANNFTLGAEGEAEGFGGSTEIVETFVNEYVQNHSADFSSVVKTWIVGYSRGGAIANMLAGHMTLAQQLGNISVAKENIFAYTFEAPAGANTDVCTRAQAQSCTNIHNIIQANDLVPKVAPNGWGFFRYGTDESIIPETRTAENSALFEAVLDLLPEYQKGTDGDGNEILKSEAFQAKRITTDPSVLLRLGTWSQNNGIYVWTPVDSDTAMSELLINSDKTFSQVLDDLITALENAIGSRESYARNVESSIRLLMSEYFGEGYQQAVLENAKTTLISQIKANKDSIIVAAVTGNVIGLQSILTDIFETVISTTDLDAESYAQVPANLLAIVPILANAIVADAVIDNGTDIISLIENIDLLFYPHEYDLSFAWVAAMDPNYNSNLQVVDARVSNVNVTVEKVKKTVKILFVKTTVTSYVYTITPVTDVDVQDISYRTLLIGSLDHGNQITRDIPLSYLYIRIKDANGNETNWEYRNGKVQQVQ